MSRPSADDAPQPRPYDQGMADTDPVAIIDTLDESEILERIEDLSHTQDALRVLLRAARARKRRSTAPNAGGGGA